ncbi:MAG: aminotransferase class III-fold pyridoxal phosphate-dependent enzyme, partial [Zwartia sp.]
LLRIKQRLQLSVAKYPSLGGHLRWAKRITRWVPGYSYTDDKWFDADGAPQEIALQRRQALAALGNDLRTRSALTLAHTAASKPMISDLQFISNYRVPYQFREVLQQHIQMGSFWTSSDGVWLTDMDGNRLIDVTGPYGVNLFGLDFYKSCIEEGSKMVRDLGPVLGSYHPCVLDNVRRLCEISGKDEVSFHMSGTEAVMQAVRLARYQTGRQKIVRFTSAYHGWWDDVQPGPGNPMPPSKHTLTLREMHENTLRVLRNRRDIACVLVNPIQAMHPNQAAPTDSTLVDGGRRANYDREAYTAWLKELRQLCAERGIIFILDEVFLGFRLAPGGAQEYFGIDADMVTYGKTLGGGLPIGILCGKKKLMTRFYAEHPADICFARGTFNAHPYVMGAMNVFLHRQDTPAVQKLYAELETTWSTRKNQLNDLLKREGLPLRVEAMSTVWTVLYDVPSRFNWLLQFYMRREGIALSWVGTGRLIFSLNFTDADFDDFCQRFVRAGHQMAAGAWWWTPQGQTNKLIRRRMLLEMVQQTKL